MHSFYLLHQAIKNKNTSMVKTYIDEIYHYSFIQKSFENNIKTFICDLIKYDMVEEIIPYYVNNFQNKKETKPEQYFFLFIILTYLLKHNDNNYLPKLSKIINLFNFSLKNNFFWNISCRDFTAPIEQITNKNDFDSFFKQYDILMSLDSSAYMDLIYQSNYNEKLFYFLIKEDPKRFIVSSIYYFRYALELDECVIFKKKFLAYYSLSEDSFKENTDIELANNILIYTETVNASISISKSSSSNKNYVYEVEHLKNLVLLRKDIEKIKQYNKLQNITCHKDEKYNQYVNKI